MATNGSFVNQDQYKSADQPAVTAGPADANAAGNNLSKDEVGWYFVEQYYTTLSKSPEKLHLFYGKRSQFVSGLEAEVANVSVGRQAIQERIKQLDFQDCKVRVSNVDSQASFDNIVIQVIGEVSNKAGEPKKFVQTFVLAQQPSGYFVLNDMLRYISEDEEEQPVVEAEQEVPAAELEVPAPEVPIAAEPESVEEDVKVEAVNADEVDQKLQEASKINGTDAEEPAEAAETAEAEPEKAAPVDAETAAKEIAEEESKEVVEKPKEPSPTPAGKPVAQPEAAPAEPAAPSKPMTWASRAAAAAGPRPVVPLPKTATPPAASQNRAPAPAAAPATAQPSAAAAAPAPTAAAAAAAPAAEAPVKEAASGWQTAGADSKRQNRPQSISANVVEKEGTMGYVKYVTEKVQDADLRSALTAFGELTYFDINRAKNCAFVEYKTVEGYQAALAGKNLTVNGENIVVEPRRPKTSTYGGNFGAGRGNASGRGRGGFDGNRPGGQNTRGNFTGQGRGRGGAARGRGGAQAANA
ncbi:ntf2 and rrm domain-containing [Trichoderma arundinaceum]|uniref:Ntf2 and rrm domain-containing n=1 Tax=Trichoderma arundinaceum TaxID=490622 RepID=A0A395NGY3_TRIAR|nr:ntf2 and rrm domain-containing [Trichoderma arundinaceum]